MKPIFLIELKRYRKDVIRSKLDINQDDFEVLEKELLKRRVMEFKKDKYYFKYVGILVFQEKIMFVLPKYTNKSNLEYVQKVKLIKLIIDVLKVYSMESVEEDELEMLGNIYEDDSFSYLSAINYFIEDYLEYGLYHSENKRYSLNGNGEINWEKTIYEQVPFVLHKEPFYLDFYTMDTYMDDENYIRTIHKLVMNKCSDLLKRTGLSDILDMPIIKFDIDEGIFSDVNFIIKRIEDELNLEYGDRKQRLLKSMRNFLLEDSSPLSQENIIFFGTKYFNNVWEKACSYVFHHDIDLLENISRPKWNNFKEIDKSKETLRPDITVQIKHMNKNRFLILDAKYYDIEFINGKVFNNPGISDIIKQYMYQQALNDFIKKHKYNVNNILLFPTIKEEFEPFGKVTLDYINDLEDVLLMYLPATKILSLYYKYKKFESSEWNHFFDKVDKATNIECLPEPESF